MANQKTNLTQTVISFKKLSGVANTSMFKTELGETIASNVQIGTNVIFGQTPPASPPTTMYETSSGAIVQRVEFDLVPIFGTTYIATAADSQAESSTSTTHSFALKLKSNYQTLGSNNPKAGTIPFTNNYFASGSGGTLQFVPPSFGLDYLVVLKDQNGTQITTGDDMDWYFDYYSGILFRQDGDNTTIPTSGSGYIYIGKYASEVISSGSGGASNGFPFSGSAVITGSLTISGSSGPELIVTGTVEVTGGITGSLFGTSSWAINSLTASYVNPLTQSVFISGGIDIYSSGNWDVYTGTHIIGTGVLPTLGAITGSGLIISASDLPTTIYNFLKVGNTEIVGYDNNVFGNTLLIHNVDSFQVTSGSDGGTIKNLFFHDGDTFEIYSKETKRASFGSSSAEISSADSFLVNSNQTAIKAAVTNNLTNGVAVFTTSAGVSPSPIGRVSSSLFILATGSNQIISGGLTITGSLNVTQGITGSLFGTASWAQSASQAISSSYALSASYAFNATSASHATTASYVNPLTQSVFISGGLEIIGTNNSTVYTGVHRIGLGVQTPLSITGSGLIISSSNLPANNYNFLKIGDVELVDNTYLGTSNEFLINNVDSFVVTSGSDPSIAPKKLFSHNGNDFEVFSDGGSDARLKVNTATTTVLSQDLAIRADAATSLAGGVLVLESVPLSNAAAIVARVPETYFIFSTGSNQIISGGLTITGSLNVSQGITGSLFGTSSWAYSASQAISASYALSASYAVTASYVLTSSVTDAALVTPTNNDSNYKVLFTFDTPTTDYERLNIDNGSGEFTYNPSTNVLSVGTITASVGLNGTASWANNAISASHALTASSVNTLNQNVIINGQLTAGTSSLANLTVTNNAIINGDLFVYGSASVINVNNLSIEDKFILLNSGSTGPIANEGGIIVQTSASDGTAYGTALFYDQEANRWLVAKSSSVAFNATSITVGATTDFIVTVSASAGSPVGTPPNFGTGNSAYSVGQMYIQTDTSDIYIYA